MFPTAFSRTRERFGLESCAHAKRPRRVRTESAITKDLSVRTPGSLRVSVTLFAPLASAKVLAPERTLA
jgi:hypothetical protein